MTKVYLYILGASSDPDAVRCHVPWYLGDGEVFFGPCKKDIREELRRDLLRGSDHAVAEEPIYFAAFNALGGGSVRKLVWAGRIREAMSFGRAWKTLRGEKYRAMREDQESPLHVEPVGTPTSMPVAYKIVSDEHRENDDWVSDLATDSWVRRLKPSGDVVRLPEGTPWSEGFGRDVCFLFEDCFFAGRDGEVGIELDDDLVELLRDAQRHRRKIDRVAIFGRNVNDAIYGRGHVTLTDRDDLAGRFLGWLAAKRRSATASPGKAATGSRTEAVRTSRGRCG